MADLACCKTLTNIDWYELFLITYDPVVVCFGEVHAAIKITVCGLDWTQ